MTELAIYKDFQLQGVLRDYLGLIWVRRFNDAGEFTLTLAATKYNVELIKSGDIIMKDGEGAFIENIESFSESGGRVTFTVSGGFLSRLLEWRIINLKKSGTAEEIVHEILQQNFINAKDINRNIPNFKINSLAQSPVSGDFEWEGQTALDCIRELTQEASLGFKIDLDVSEESLLFSMFEGRRSTALFSELYKNILTQEYANITKDYKNTCIIKTDTSLYTYGGERSGLARREGYTTTSAKNTEPLENQAKAFLMGCSKIENLDVVLNTQSKQFVYKTDWDLGDIVTSHSDFWGVTIEKNVLEITEYHEMGGFNLAVVFGDITKMKGR